MSGHLDQLRERLPSLYREGDLLTDVLAVLALQFEIVDERARIVQRAHWFDTTPVLAEAAALGAILDIPPEEGQDLGRYRAWLNALRTARLTRGAVTVEALKGFVQDYASGFEAADDRAEYLGPFGEWSDRPVDSGHALVEFPPRRRVARLGGPGATEPLARTIVHHRGMDPAPVSLLAVGGADGEYVPLIVNLTTGRGLLLPARIAAGQRLWVGTNREGRLEGRLEREDVTDDLIGIRRVTPGSPWTPDDVEAPELLTLLPGANELWFLPVARFDEPGLDRALLGLADLDLIQGRWDAAALDHAVYYMDPELAVDLSWVESVPATLLVDLDAAVLRSSTAETAAGVEARSRLERSLASGIGSLVAAGVEHELRFRPAHDSQRQLDSLVAISGRSVREVGTIGRDRIRSSDGLFGISEYGESTYQ